MPRTIRTRVMAATLGALVVAASAGCGGSTLAGGTASQRPKPKGPVPTAASSALEPKAKAEGTVVWYTSNTRPTANKIKTMFEAAHPGVKVQLFQAGGAQVLSKVESEINGGGLHADVVDYSDGAAMLDQSRRGVFARFAPEHASQVPGNLKDPDGYWISSGSYLTASIAYNTKRVTAAQAPRGWRDLLSPKWKGKVSFGSPDYAGTALSTLAGWQKALGKDYVSKLGGNGLQVAQSFGDVENAVVSGQAPVGVVLSFRALADQADGKPIKVVDPSEGQIELLTAVGVSAKAAHPNAARLFENFLFGDAVQKYLAKNYFFPARPGFDVPGEPASARKNLIVPDLKQLSDPDTVARLKKDFKQATS